MDNGGYRDGKDEIQERQGGSANHDNGATVESDKEEAGKDRLDDGGSGSGASGAVGGEEPPSTSRDGGGDGRPKRPPRVGSVRQGRKLKRKAAWEAKKAWLKENKRLAREKREEEMRKEGREPPVAGANYRDLPREQWSISQKINFAKRQEFEEKSAASGYRVCIDMAFDDLMLEKAKTSLRQQVMFAYSKNRKATQPCRITLSGMGTAMGEKISKLTGFDTWLGVATDSRCYTEIFDKDELVYLTADSPDTITQLEKGKVYILGGLVDRNAHKGICFKKATDQGIATAKLPLKKGDLFGAHTKVLATNHVFDILLQAMESGGNLQKVEEMTLPPRKRAGWAGGDDRGPSSKPKPATASGSANNGVEQTGGGNSQEKEKANPEGPACSSSRCSTEKDNGNGNRLPEEQEGVGGEEAGAGAAVSSGPDLGHASTPTSAPTGGAEQAGQEKSEETEAGRRTSDGCDEKGKGADAGEAQAETRLPKGVGDEKAAQISGKNAAFNGDGIPVTGYR